MADLCPICEGSGLRVVERANGLRVAEPCECRAERRLVRMMEQARIPKRYEHCKLEEYVPNYDGNNQSLSAGLLQAKSFVKAYPVETGGQGLLFSGAPGLGKTHLAVGILRSLILERGAQGMFVDYRELLKQVQNSYNRNVEMTELEVLKPVFDAEVLVLDDLGASKPTDWVWDTVAHILNSRYNEQLTTIITTNFPNLPETKSEELARKNESQRIMSERTLGDRIGERMRSRLQEMCVVVEMAGEDFRQKVKRASFA